MKWLRRFHARPEGVESSVANDVKTVDVMKRMMPFLWPASRSDIKKYVVFAILLLILAKILNVLTPYILKYIVDKLTSMKTLDSLDAKTALKYTIYGLLAMYALSRIGSALFNEFKNAVFSRVSQGSIRKMSNDCFEHLQKLDLDFHHTRKTGMVSKSIDRGTRAISYILTAMAFNIIPTTFEIAMVSALMVTHFGPAFAITTLSTIASYVTFTYFITNWRTKYRIQMNQADNECSSKAFEAFINHETIKYFNNEEFERKEFDKILRKYEEASKKTISSLALLNFGQRAIFSVGIAAIMALATGSIVLDSLTVGDIVLVNGLLTQLSIPLNFLGSTYRDLRQSFVDLNNLYDIMKIEPKIKNTANCIDISWPYFIDQAYPVIALKNVSYSYFGHPVLKNLSLEIPFANKTAIVGSSGSGKSTIVRLTYRFIDPDKGDIYFLGKNIKNLSIESLRRLIAVVPQDQVLFHNTIMYNIRYGNMNATDAEVFNAARIAGVHDSIIRFPKGYESQVGERGQKLSGGEKQRVAIARALLKQSPILICDEATSSLDSITEKKIINTLSNAFADRTSVVIAHRLSTIVDADNIFVLQNGNIVEKGKHLELLINNPLGTYSLLWRKQYETVQNVKHRENRDSLDDTDIYRNECSKEGCCTK